MQVRKVIDAPAERAWQLLVNTNLSGDNGLRGIVLGVLLGLINAVKVNEWFEQLVDRQQLADEIDALLTLTHTES